MKGIDLKKTDPGLVEHFEHFANEMALPASGLDVKQANAVILAANVALNASAAFPSLVEKALDAGLSAEEIRECVYQTIPFVGFSKAVGFVQQMDAVFEEKGIQLPLPSAATVTYDEAFDAGLTIMKENFGSYIETLGSLKQGDSTDFNHWLVSYGFGEFFTRKVLDVRTRELLSYATLLSMDGALKQLRTHVRVNLKIGNDKDLLLNVLKVLTPYIGFPKTFAALNTVESVYQEEIKFS